jgi:hypothetical protein
MKYKNSFYNKDKRFPGSYEFYEGEPELEYKGYLIFEIYRYENPRRPGLCHIVKDNICIGMYAGMNGAKKFIDEGLFKNDK